MLIMMRGVAHWKKFFGNVGDKFYVMILAACRPMSEFARWSMNIEATTYGKLDRRDALPLLLPTLCDRDSWLALDQTTGEPVKSHTNAAM